MEMDPAYCLIMTHHEGGLSSKATLRLRASALIMVMINADALSGSLLDMLMHCIIKDCLTVHA